MLGYAYIWFILVVVILLTIALVILLIKAPYLIVKLGLPMLLAIGIILRSFWIKLEPIEGIRITREDAPEIFATVEEIAFRRVDVRIAEYLAELTEEQAYITITHQEIAYELGTAREVVSRILKDFERANTISLSRGSITVKNKITGDNLIIPQDILIKRILIKKNNCHDDLTRGTSIVFGLSKNEKPKLIENFNNLHKDPGVLSDELNKHFEGSDTVFAIDVKEKSTLIKEQYLVVKCALGEEINSGSIDVCIECELIRH